MLEAILLVGGQGTRLRPLTISTPKPMLPVAGYACTEHQIALAREAGIDRIILGTSYRAEVFESHFGHGEEFGIELIYAVEAEPLGTGGAIRNAAQHLTCGPDDPVVVFNGDVLTGIDIAGLVQKWQDANADVALYLTRVEDPRPYGLVPTDADGRVLEFLEKPTTPDEIVTDQINAGCYVFKRSVIDSIPADRPVSVERETFPELLAANRLVIGVVDDGYWLDLGTPLAFAKGSADLVQGIAPSPLLVGRTGPAIIEKSATVDPSATITGGTYIGHNAIVGAGAVIDRSVIFNEVQISSGSRVTYSIISTAAHVGSNCHIVDTVIAERAFIDSDNELSAGSLVFPDERIEAGSIRFTAEQN
jgi:mannose-1-phosphate guanylyltransferase